MTKNPFVQFSLATILILMVVAAIFALLISQYGIETIGPWAVLAVLVLLLCATGSWLARGIKIAAADDPTSPIKIETFNDSFQASALVARLEEVGVRATAVGGYVSGFQAESPGYVDVVVPKSDFETAKRFMAEFAAADGE